MPSSQVSKQVQQQGMASPQSTSGDAMGGGELSESDFLHYGIRGSMFNRAVVMEDLNNIAELAEEEDPIDDDDEDNGEEYSYVEEATTVCEDEAVVEEDLVPEPTADLPDGPIKNPIVVTENNASRWMANETDFPGGESL